VPLAGLTVHQHAAAAGRYAQALAGFVRWLAGWYGEAPGRLSAERARLRERAMTGVGSARTPGIVADLALGLKCLLDFAVAVGAATDAERDALARRGWQALQEAAAAQAKHVGDAEPTALFRRLLIAALASGRAHVAGPDGLAPRDPEAWGWRRKELAFGAQFGAEPEPGWLAQGRRVGWVEEADLYLEPEASYAAAQEMARDQGDGMPVTVRTLRKRLHERGLLAGVDGEREVLTVRRTLEGKRRDVMHLSAAFLSAEKPDQPDHGGRNPGENGRVCGRVPPGPAADPTTEPDPNAQKNGQSVGLVGSDAGTGPATARKDSAPHGKRRRGEL
jgi:hypothetical protein